MRATNINSPKTAPLATTLTRVSDSQTEIDKKCQYCHESYESFGQKDQKTGLKISAHKGHLSIDSCTTCHNGHVGSFAYCNNCHIFDMSMKFSRNKVTYDPEDLSIYKNANPNRIEKADAVVIGGGVAAIELARAGKNVVLLEKMPIIGGSSLLATGGLNAAYTELQKAADVKDDEETFFNDTLKMGKGTNARISSECLYTTPTPLMNGSKLLAENLNCS